MTFCASDVPDDIAAPDPPTISAVETNPIRLLLVDDKLIVREGVCALLDQHQGFHVVAQAGSVAEAALFDVRPDVVITDLVLPDARGTEVVVGLQGRFPHAAIFVLIDDARVAPLGEIAASGAGVTGFALKTATADEFLAGLRTVAQGVRYVQPALRGALVPANTAPATPPTARVRARAGPDLDSLTGNEREVLRFLVLGHTNSEIAALCGVSLRTVEARRSRLLHKLGVRTRAELVRVAQHLGGTDTVL